MSVFVDGTAELPEVRCARSDAARPISTAHDHAAGGPRGQERDTSRPRPRSAGRGTTITDRALTDQPALGLRRETSSSRLTSADAGRRLQHHDRALDARFGRHRRGLRRTSPPTIGVNRRWLTLRGSAGLGPDDDTLGTGPLQRATASAPGLDFSNPHRRRFGQPTILFNHRLHRRRRRRGHAHRRRSAPQGARLSAQSEPTLEFGEERPGDVGAIERVGDVGGQEADLAAAIEDCGPCTSRR